MAPTAWFSALLVSLIPQSVYTTVPALTMSLKSQSDDVRPLTPEEIAAFKPYSWYASTVACNISDISTWTCGKKCDENPFFEHITAKEYGEGTQFWFSGYDPTLDEVIVAHQGTNGSDILAVLSNFDIALTTLNSTLFPGIDQSVLVHRGYARSQNRTALDVLDAVQKTLSLYQTKKVTVVGASLGAAIALLDAVFLPLHLPSDVTVRYIGYSPPRIGNQAFADYVDAQNMSITRMNNKQDPVPVLPLREFFEYHHVSGEIRIRNDDVWVECPGQDNPSDQCSTGAVTFATANAGWHNGPFDGVDMGGCEAS